MSSGYMWKCYAAALAGSISPHLHRDRWQRSVRSHSRLFQCYIKAELTVSQVSHSLLSERCVWVCVCVCVCVCVLCVCVWMHTSYQPLTKEYLSASFIRQQGLRCFSQWKHVKDIKQIQSNSILYTYNQKPLTRWQTLSKMKLYAAVLILILNLIDVFACMFMW